MTKRHDLYFNLPQENYYKNVSLFIMSSFAKNEDPQGRRKFRLVSTAVMSFGEEFINYIIFCFKRQNHVILLHEMI